MNKKEHIIKEKISSQDKLDNKLDQMKLDEMIQAEIDDLKEVIKIWKSWN